MGQVTVKKKKSRKLLTNHSFVGAMTIALALTRQDTPRVLMTDYGFLSNEFW